MKKAETVKKSNKSKKKKPAEDKTTGVHQVTPDESGKTFDFGGLPERDLKKNLGCG